MRVYKEGHFVFFDNGSTVAVPDKQASFERSGDVFELFNHAIQERFILNYSQILNQAGSGFGDADAVETHLTSVMSLN